MTLGWLSGRGAVQCGNFGGEDLPGGQRGRRRMGEMDVLEDSASSSRGRMLPRRGLDFICAG